MKKAENKLYEKIVNHLVKMVFQGQTDQLITGNQFWEFSDRKIELKDPMEIMKNDKNSKKNK